jgi:hypothetical protein
MTKTERDYAHKKMREAFENAVQFIALAILLMWARAHTSSILAATLVNVCLLLCLLAAGLRMLCVLATPSVEEALKKERPWLAARTIHKGDVYRLIAGLWCIGIVGLCFVFYFMRFA